MLLCIARSTGDEDTVIETLPCLQQVKSEGTTRGEILDAQIYLCRQDETPI